MAGIGFRLQRLLERGTTGSQVQALFYSAVISSGPWLISVLCLGLLTVLAPANLGLRALEATRVTIVYCYALSLITVGLVHMVLTRHVADKLFAADDSALVPTFFTSGAVLVAVQLAWGLAAGALLEGPILYRLTAVSLYIIVSLIWHAMIFLSAARDFEAIVGAFAAGSAVCVGAAWVLGTLWGWIGFLVGFTLGQGVIWALLACRVLIEFDAERVLDLSVLGAFRRYPQLIGVGLFYNLGIWVDKFAFWYGPDGRPVISFLYTYAYYDSAMFVAYLTVVPASALFLIRVETGFYQAYRDFYGAIHHKEGLSSVRARHRALGRALDMGLGDVLKVQGAITGLCLVFSDAIASGLALPPPAFGMFRVGILGAFLHTVFLTLLIMVLYFDLRLEALRLSGLFCVLNLGLTLASQRMGFAWFGYGYAAAALVCLGLAYLILARRVRRLLFLTFVGQPVLVPTVEEEASPGGL
ncbi:MAG: exopolysaccharide Pel transporter PelG [Planctomycetes bacterium]|nr:exopolysaccharide Pel transporter PelG [Planctomycetota bacterium]